ncbi:uncharacterized protein LOC122883498 isoform X2 [Siniperca chuatsi]|uniref:uncharacterized protein LOC122883498 isoform X2 n=1 Tax=Siniperca chuatsi TaxID=119488 RepID=UPI001CE22FD1|nr:uncharacterized protein LOC122883498 isoform X2 [Siniperca chuatsi]
MPVSRAPIKEEHLLMGGQRDPDNHHGGVSYIVNHPAAEGMPELIRKNEEEVVVIPILSSDEDDDEAVLSENEGEGIPPLSTDEDEDEEGVGIPPRSTDDEEEEVEEEEGVRVPARPLMMRIILGMRVTKRALMRTPAMTGLNFLTGPAMILVMTPCHPRRTKMMMMTWMMVMKRMRIKLKMASLVTMMTTSDLLALRISHHQNFGRAGKNRFLLHSFSLCNKFFSN